jgi:hypothetical protein
MDRSIVSGVRNGMFSVLIAVLASATLACATLFACCLQIICYLAGLTRTLRSHLISAGTPLYVAPEVRLAHMSTCSGHCLMRAHSSPHWQLPSAQAATVVTMHLIPGSPS